jgi:hypothetical protein
MTTIGLFQEILQEINKAAKNNVVIKSFERTAQTINKQGYLTTNNIKWLKMALNKLSEWGYLNLKQVATYELSLPENFSIEEITNEEANWLIQTSHGDIKASYTDLKKWYYDNKLDKVEEPGENGRSDRSYKANFYDVIMSLENDWVFEGYAKDLLGV